jgi:phosphoglycerate dehydrogenase-like enzyme
MKFITGISGDLINSEGVPCFGEKSLEKIYNRADIDLVWMDPNITEISQDMAAKFDAILLNLPKATKKTVERSDCRLKIISRFGVGYDSVDIVAMKNKNIIVTNTPNAVRRPVAVAALTMIFSLSGKLLLKDKLVRSGSWNERTNHMGVGLTEKTLGVLGAGNIGSELIQLSKPFFGEIISYDPFLSREELNKKGVEKVELSELAKKSDFVVILCNLNENTKNLIDIKFFKQMKDSSFIINMSRGPVIKEKDLIFALKNKLIMGAGLDVMTIEPVEKDNPLLEMKNTVLTPHALCWTDECFADIANEAIESILNYKDNKKIKNRVN